MRKRSEHKIKTKYLLGSLTGICIVLMALTFINPSVTIQVQNASSYIVLPVQRGINKMGSWFTSKSDNLKQLQDVISENEDLRRKVDELTEENSLLVQNKYEAERLRDLVELSEQYVEYDKVGARIIAKENGNWFHSFTINKGSNDGIEEDMNVIANGGLVGIITKVGDNYSKVKAIIDDDSNLSAKSASSSDRCIVEGDLQLIEEGFMTISNLPKNSTVKEGDMILTSPISSKYLPGILVGYITKLSEDSNALTKSGVLIPVVDFQHLEEVLVIKELKANQTKDK